MFMNYGTKLLGPDADIWMQTKRLFPKLFLTKLKLPDSLLILEMDNGNKYHMNLILGALYCACKQAKSFPRIDVA